MTQNDPLTERIIAAAIEVHRTLGPGLLESAYEDCLALEMSLRGMSFQRQISLPVRYKTLNLVNAYRCDFIVEEKVVVELKIVETILKVHDSQVRTYLKLSGVGVGLLINFNSALLKDGIRRYVRPGFVVETASKPDFVVS